MAIKQSITERFWPKVDVRGPGDCWKWLAYTDAQGYGYMGAVYGRTPALAHRVAYELVVGPIPNGLQIDHLCRNASCVNPAHLEPVTQSENMRRRRKPFCARGHAMVDSNIRPGKNRGCLACAKESDRIATKRKREARAIAHEAVSITQRSHLDACVDAYIEALTGRFEGRA